MSIVLVIRYESDNFADEVSKQLELRNVETMRVAPQDLGNLVVTLAGNLLLVNQKSVSGILFRCSPTAHFADVFNQEDQYFANVENRAFWLAALQLNSIYTVNRFDADEWFNSSSWILWRNRLWIAGLAVSPILFGNEFADLDGLFNWAPSSAMYIRPVPHRLIQNILGVALTPSHPNSEYLVVGDGIFAENPPPIVDAVRTVLNSYGVRLATITLDENENVLFVNTLPHIPMPITAAAVIAEEYYAAMHLC